MLKLLKIKKNLEAQIIDLEFSNGQSATLYKFGKDWISNTSELVVKSSLREIKEKLVKSGVDADLDEFINKEYEEYFENF
ncbi:MAG TPA: hypothetical protein VLA48_02720 [Nitrososphaeraceae archaeon]|nr:hypothetical protein [Nitrososphaeraceae archaeon]